MTLRQFIYSALDLEYFESHRSNALINPEDRVKVHFAKKVWTSCQEIDIGRDYDANYVKPFLLSR